MTMMANPTETASAEVTYNGTWTKYYPSPALRAGFAGAARVTSRTCWETACSAPTFLLADHLGSTSLTTDANGVKTSEMRYNPWGAVRYENGLTLTNYTFTDQYSYTDTFGLMFYNARWYDVQLGRFAQADSLIPLQSQGVQAWDRYAYVNNNPVKYDDPSGHDVGCGSRDASECGSKVIVMIGCGVSDGLCGPGTASMAPAYEYAVENGYQVYFYDPDDSRYNEKHAKYDAAQDMVDRIENSPDNDIYMVGYSAGADAVVLAIEMSGYSENIDGVGLIDPYLNYATPDGDTGFLQSAADNIAPSGITIALADSSAKKKEHQVSIAGAVLPKNQFSYNHIEMGMKPDVFNFIFKTIAR